MAWMGLSFVVQFVAFFSALRIAREAIPKAEMAAIRMINAKARWRVEDLLRLDGAVGDFVRSVEAESDAATRLERVSERIAEVDDTTWGVDQRISRWSRVALFAGVACSIAYLCEGLASNRLGNPLRFASPFVLGAVVAVGCRWGGRLAGAASHERRRAWDTLSSVLLRPLFLERNDKHSIDVAASGLTSRCQSDA